MVAAVVYDFLDGDAGQLGVTSSGRRCFPSILFCDVVNVRVIVIPPAAGERAVPVVIVVLVVPDTEGVVLVQ